MKTTRCTVCREKRADGAMCLPCMRKLSRQRFKPEHAHAARVGAEWAAERARYYERKRNRKENTKCAE